MLTKDKSLVSFLYHELSHEWFGNLVTIDNWQNLWLNEGFDMFLQRKTTEIIYGEDMANIEATNGYYSFLESVKMLGPLNSYTSLFPQFNDTDPLDALSSVTYEKGFNLLYYLQRLVGKTNFQAILKQYVQLYKFNSVDYEDFQTLFESQVTVIFPIDKANEILANIDWNSWILRPGNPPVINTFRKFNFCKKSSFQIYQRGQ